MACKWNVIGSPVQVRGCLLALAQDGGLFMNWENHMLTHPGDHSWVVERRRLSGTVPLGCLNFIVGDWLILVHLNHSRRGYGELEHSES